MKALKIATLLLIAIKLSLAQFQCPWYSFNAGSNNLETNNFRAQGTVAQSAIGKLTSQSYLSSIGFWYPSLISALTDDKHQNNSTTQLLPTKLYPAYPNPMTNQTTIKYSLAFPQQVTLEIYDVSGRLISTLVNAYQAQGIYTINWHKTTSQRQKLSSGLYFYTLRTENYRETKKLIITN
ncbi:MAG: T9SS type A sorting domain-containing protein [candidate division WOR-3 bacterium]